MKLSSFLSLFATVLTVFSSLIFGLVAVFYGGLDPRFLFEVVPLAILAYIVSIPFAHWASQPFSQLIKRLENRKADSSLMESDKPFAFSLNLPSDITEADELAANFDELMDATRTSYEELDRLYKHQDEFVADMAHELRTPLTAISGNAELMMDPDMPQAMRKRFCEITLTESQRMSNLVNSMLDIERIKSGQDFTLEPTNIEQVAHDAIDVLYPIAHSQNATLSITGVAPDIMADEHRLRQALINLVDNGLHHIPDGGSVRIDLSSRNDNSVISVIDNGCGFGDVDPQLLFERLYRTDKSRARRRGGNGLGLTIVQEIVKAMNGTITASNVPEGGAVFVIEVPSIQDSDE